MLKRATLSLAIGLALSTSGHAQTSPDYVAKQQTVSSVTSASLQNAVDFQSDIIINDTAYRFTASQQDRFGSTFTFTSTSSNDVVIVRQRADVLSAFAIIGGVQKQLSVQGDNATLTTYNLKYKESDPVNSVTVNPTPSPQWHALRPQSTTAKRAVSEVVSELPDEVGVVFFISAATFVEAEALAADSDTDTSPMAIQEQNVATFNNAIEEAGVSDIQAKVQNYYLVADDAELSELLGLGRFWEADDVIAKAELGSGDMDFLSAVHLTGFDEGVFSRPRALALENDDFENVTQLPQFVKESHLKYVPFPSTSLARAFGRNVALNRERAALEAPVSGALPYAFVDGDVKTIMASGSDGTDTVASYSNPDIQRNGSAIGESGANAADNAQFLRKTFPVLANATNLKSDSSITINETDVTLSWTPLPDTTEQTVIRSSYACIQYSATIGSYTVSNSTTLPTTSMSSVNLNSSTDSCLVVVNWINVDGNSVPVIRAMQEYRGDDPFVLDNVNVSTVPGSSTTVPLHVLDESISNDDLLLYITKLQGPQFINTEISEYPEVAAFLSYEVSGSGSERELTISVDSDYRKAVEFISTLNELAEVQPQLLTLQLNLDGTQENYSVSLDMRGLYDAIPRAYSDKLVGKVNSSGGNVSVTVTESLSESDITVTSVTEGFSDWEPEFTTSTSDGETTITVNAPADMFSDTDDTFAVVRVEFGSPYLYKQLGFIHTDDESTDDGGDAGGGDSGGGDSGGGNSGGDSGGSTGGSDSSGGSTGSGDSGGGGGSTTLFGLLALGLAGLGRRFIRR